MLKIFNTKIQSFHQEPSLHRYDSASTMLLLRADIRCNGGAFPMYAQA
jgi:hypothetical protein